MSRITKSLWRYFTRSTLVTPQLTDIVPLAVQPGTDMVTDISHCTVNDIVSLAGGVVIRDVLIGELDGSGDNVFIDPVGYNMFRLAIRGKDYSLMFDIALGDATGGPRSSMLLGLPTDVPQIFDNGGNAVYYSNCRWNSTVGPALFVFAGGGNYQDLGFGLRNYLQMGSVVNYTAGTFENWTASPGSDRIQGTIEFTTV